jgi:NAD(P)H-hydrate epimerase
MKVVFANEIKTLDNKTIEKFGIDSLVLMERAGLSVLETLKKYYSNLKKKKVTVVCGKGNNGGDGLVLARELLNNSRSVYVIMLDNPQTKESMTNFKIYKNSGGEIKFFNFENKNEVINIIKNSDLVIDAIFGVGLTKPVSGKYYEIIDIINNHANYVVSIDIPSGLSSDNGKVMGISVKANITVTFEFPKVGHLLFPGRELTGKLEVVKIGFPKKLIEEHKFDKFLITSDLVKIPERLKDSNKGTYGKVFIIGGSKNYIGAPLLSALSAMVSGAGKVYITSFKDVVLNAVNFEPGIIPLILEGENFTLKHLKKILSFEDEKTVFVLGPGIGNNSETKEFTSAFIEKIKSPIIVDADAIVNLSENLETLKNKNNIILTPHPGEFSKLYKISLKDVKYNFELLKNKAKEYQNIIVLKDSTTMISDGNLIYFNISGNSSLSKGGSGDVLSGLIAGFVAQGLDLFESSISSVYINGIASELFEPEGRNRISEIINLIPKAIKKILKEKEEINGILS